jgi:hypothetical protein
MKFIQDLGITWPNAYGARATLQALGVRGVPTTFVVARDGRIAWNDELGGDLDDAIQRALGAHSTR